jgi:hypothetical protein
MSKKHIVFTFLLLAFGFGYSQTSQAQCKGFTKKHCLSELEGYTGNGQYNGAVMFEGESATLVQTFYSRKDYRLYVCAHDAISDSLYFEVTDYKKNVLFSSRKKDADFFDFSVSTTQQLYIRIVVPDMGTANELKKNGCVSILVGFKEN